MLIVPTLQRGYAVVTLQRPCADHHRKAGSRRHTPSFARNPMPPASPTETCPSGGGPSIARLRLRLAQTGMHRKHPVALDQTGRGSTQGCIHTLERGNDQARDQSFCGPFPILSRAWPAPETSIVVGRSGPRPRCQGGHARWWPPLTLPGGLVIDHGARGTPHAQSILLEFYAFQQRSAVVRRGNGSGSSPVALPGRRVSRTSPHRKNRRYRRGAVHRTGPGRPVCPSPQSFPVYR